MVRCSFGHVICYLPKIWNVAPDRCFVPQNYNFSTNPQGDGPFFFFCRAATAHVFLALALAVAWDLWPRPFISVLLS